MRKYQKLSCVLLLVCALFTTNFQVQANEVKSGETPVLTEEEAAEETESVEQSNDISESEATPESEADQETEASPETEAAQASARAAQYIYGFNVIGLSGTTKDDIRIKETFSESGQNVNGAYTIEAKNTYLGTKELVFSVRIYGTLGRVTFNAPECKVTTGDIYAQDVGIGVGVVAYTQDYKVSEISPDTKELHIQAIVNTQYTGGAAKVIERDIIIPIHNARLDMPESATIVFDEQYPDSYVLQGIDSTMEYASYQNPYRAAYEWKDCPEGSMVLKLEKEAMNYLVRYKATETAEASNYKMFALPKRRVSPSVTLDLAKENITGLTTAMEYCIGETDYIAVTDELIQNGLSEIIDGITDTSINMKVRFKASGQPVSEERSFTLYKRLEAPKDISINPLTFDMSGVKTGMEYKAETMSTWYPTGVTTIKMGEYCRDDREVSVQVRYKANKEASSSKSITVSLPQLKNAPTGFAIDYTKEVMTGFDASTKYEYSYVATGRYSPITLTNGVWGLGKYYISTTKDNEVFIRKAATANAPFTASTKMVIPMRKAAPKAKIAFVYNDPETTETQASIINVDSKIEYRSYYQSNWNTCLDGKTILNLPVVDQRYLFREKATNQSFVSLTREVTFMGPIGKVPSRLSNVSESISPIYPTMEYKVNDGKFEPVGDISSLSMKEIADSLPEGESYKLDIRYARGEAYPAGQTTTFVIKPRPKPPTGVKYDVATCIVSGVDKKMEYREVGTEKWNKITVIPLNMKYYIANRPSQVQLEIRYYAANQGNEYTFTSSPIILNLY